MLSIRLADVGPIGLVRAPPPLTLAAVRELLSDQLADRLPEHGYAFLVGGVAISVGQEANEELYKEGDVFIVANPAPGTAPAARSVHNSPSVTLVRQFVDAFTCMAPDEQAEAVSLLRKRHPSAAALFDRGAPYGAPGTASASAAPVPPPPPPAAALASPPLMPGTPEAEGGGVPVGRCKGCIASARKSSNTYPCTADQPCIRLFQGPEQASSKEHTCKFSGCRYCGPKMGADELAKVEYYKPG